MKKRVILPQSFLLMGILGFLIVAIYGYYGSIATPWAVAMGTVFMLMIIASFVSMAPENI